MTDARRRLGRLSPAVVALGTAAVVGLGVSACGDDNDQEQVTLGLITKQEANPFWVTMKDVAQDTANDDDVQLLTATGRSDVDYESQVRAIEDMTRRGAKGILIAPTDSEAVVPAIRDARRG